MTTQKKFPKALIALIVISIVAILCGFLAVTMATLPPRALVKAQMFNDTNEELAVPGETRSLDFTAELLKSLWPDYKYEAQNELGLHFIGQQKSVEGDTFVVYPLVLNGKIAKANDGYVWVGFLTERELSMVKAVGKSYEPYYTVTNRDLQGGPSLYLFKMEPDVAESYKGLGEY